MSILHLHAFSQAFFHSFLFQRKITTESIHLCFKTVGIFRHQLIHCVAVLQRLLLNGVLICHCLSIRLTNSELSSNLQAFSNWIISRGALSCRSIILALNDLHLESEENEQKRWKAKCKFSLWESSVYLLVNGCQRAAGWHKACCENCIFHSKFS